MGIEGEIGDEEICAEACALTHSIQKIVQGKPTASVYMAIADNLAAMELRAETPDREDLFKMIAIGMDEYIASVRGEHETRQ